MRYYNGNTNVIRILYCDLIDGLCSLITFKKNPHNSQLKRLQYLDAVVEPLFVTSQ